MFHLTLKDPLVGETHYEVLNSKDETIAVYALEQKERAELVVRILNSEYEAITAYFAQH
jgi:hypothetical protein